MIFRPPSKNYWVGIAVTLFLYGFFASIWYVPKVASANPDTSLTFCWALLLLLVTIGMGWEFYELRRTHLIIDANQIVGWTKYNKVNLAWSEVIIAERYKHVVLLITAETTHSISLAKLDGDNVWQAIQALARPQTLAPDAYKNHPQYEHDVARYKQLLADETLVVELKHGLVGRIFTWTFTLVVAGVIVVLVATATEIRQWTLAALYGFILVVAAADIIRVSTHIKATPRTLQLRRLWHEKTISWIEVQKVQYTSSSKVWKIYSHEKRITFAIPSSKNTQQFMDLLYAQLWAQNMIVHENNPVETIYIRQQASPGN